MIALTYPVGIWDYLGWDDTFAKKEFTERQKRYNRVLNYRGPYTPQVVYSGRLHGPGTDIKDIEEAFGRRDISPYPVSVSPSMKDARCRSPAHCPQGCHGEGWRHRRPLPPRRHERHARRRREQGQADVLLEPRHQVRAGRRMEVGGAQRYAVTCDSACVVMVQKNGAEGMVIGAAQKK